MRVSPFTKAQNDNAEFLLCASNAFVAAVSCKLFGCFALRSALAVIMSCRSLQVDISPFLLTHCARNGKVTCKIPCHTEPLAKYP